LHDPNMAVGGCPPQRETVVSARVDACIANQLLDDAVKSLGSRVLDREIAMRSRVRPTVLQQAAHDVFAAPTHRPPDRCMVMRSRVDTWVGQQDRDDIGMTFNGRTLNRIAVVGGRVNTSVFKQHAHDLHMPFTGRPPYSGIAMGAGIQSLPIGQHVSHQTDMPDPAGRNQGGRPAAHQTPDNGASQTPADIVNDDAVGVIRRIRGDDTQDVIIEVVQAHRAVRSRWPEAVPAPGPGGCSCPQQQVECRPELAAQQLQVPDGSPVGRDSERAQTMAGGYACGRVTAEVFAASARAVANIKPDWEADCDQRRLVLSARVRLPGPDGDEDVPVDVAWDETYGVPVLYMNLSWDADWVAERVCADAGQCEHPWRHRLSYSLHPCRTAHL
ncbi:hypothetical protein PBRA_000414, partial [Plasmodiophora brassicae]